MKTLSGLIHCLVALALFSTWSVAQTTSINRFTYQGRLNDSAGPANGVFDFTFALFSQPVGGPPFGAALLRGGVPVSNGLFTVVLEFPNAFSGADRWLEISVRSNGVTTYTALSPRQQITAAPYAIRAREASTMPPGAITGAMIAEGAISAPQLASGAALENLLAGGMGSVSAGGVVMSDEPSNPGLVAQGYVRIPNGELSLAQEKWTQFPPPAATAEFIPGAMKEIVLAAGSEIIVLRFPPDDATRLEVIRYNPANGEFTKGATSPANAVAPGASAVWTGTQVLLFGGEQQMVVGEEGETELVYENRNSVLIYTPASNQWSVMAGTGAVPFGRTLHAAVWTGSRMLVWGGERAVQTNFVFFREFFREDLNTGAAFDPVTGAWTTLSATGAPSARRGVAAVWTGSRMLVQGGTRNNRAAVIGDYLPVELSATNVFNDGFSYNPANNTWAPIRSDGTAPRQAFAQSVWSGSEMFTAGGLMPGFVSVNGTPGWEWLPTRAVNAYNPGTDVWAFRGVPDATGTNVNGRRYGTLAWTGAEVVIAGGEGLNETVFWPYKRNDAQAYNVAGASWRTLPQPPLDGGVGSWSVWVSNRLVVCDPPEVLGFSYSNPKRAAYFPAGNSWETLRNYFGPEPLKQDDPTVVWTGSELIVWGGPVNGAPSNRGRRFNPVTRQWIEMTTSNAPAPRMRHSAVWSGSRMIVWGGDAGGDPWYPATIFSNGGAYDPVNDRWEAIAAAPFDPAFGDTFKRTGHKAVWTAHGMVVVGGSDGYNNQGQTFAWSIARLSVSLDEWDISSVNSPPLLGRTGHALATDGNRNVLLWGGQNRTDQGPIGTGMLIDAFSLFAAEIGSTDEPEPTRGASMIWSGTEFIVWGGEIIPGKAAGGGSRYNPISESWTPPQMGGPVLTTTHAGHTAAWSGTEMLLWGGTSNASGARYNPRSDGWVPMSAGPAMRKGASGLWTGRSLLLYLPALASQGAVPELWEYTPPAKVYFYLKQ